jgi:hypothetical protein
MKRTSMASIVLSMCGRAEYMSAGEPNRQVGGHESYSAGYRENSRNQDCQPAARGSGSARSQIWAE